MAVRFLPDGATYELYDTQRSTDEATVVVGYVFSSAGAGIETNGSDQIQRWVLFSSLSSDIFPRRSLQLRPAQADPWRTITDRERFITTARSQFRFGFDKYIKANCKYITDQVAIARPVLFPGFLNGTHGGSQADIGTCPIALAIAGGAAVDAGYLYTHRINTDQTKEYWVLLPDYRTPTSVDIVLVGGQVMFSDSDDFVSFFDRMAGWTREHTLMVASCDHHVRIPGAGDSDVV